MRGKLIVRISRRNEFNRYWALFIVSAVLYGILSLRIRATTEIMVIVFAFSVILILTTLIIKMIRWLSQINPEISSHQYNLLHHLELILTICYVL